MAPRTSTPRSATKALRWAVGRAPCSAALATRSPPAAAQMRLSPARPAICRSRSARPAVGGAGGAISTGSSSNAFIAGQAGNMSIQIGSSGSATIYDVQGSSGVGGDTITAVAGGTASANVILASGDRVDLTGGLGNATINALAGNDTVTLGSGMATVFAAQATRLPPARAPRQFWSGRAR